MINFSGTSDLKLQFNAVQDIFPKLCLSKNKTKYNFQKDGVLGQNIVKPVIKTKWFNWTLEGLVLQAAVSKELDYDDYFECYVSEEYKYADDWIFIDSVLYWLGRMVPELTHDLDYYFSLSHTELFVGKTAPVTFYFNEGNKYEGITWNRTIYIKGR